MDITSVMSAIIALLSAIVTTFVIPWIKAKIGAERLNQAMEWVKIAANAAEQIYSGPGRGEEKKRYVLELLSQKGIAVDEKALDALIEAEVRKIGAGLAK